MSTDQAAAVIDWLVAQCQASPRLGAANPPVQVFDGPTLSGTQLAGQKRIWIGAEGPAETGQGVEAASFTEDFAFLDHARTFDNQVDVNCAAEVWDGDPTLMQATRDSVFALLGAVELLLRGDSATAGPGDASMGNLVYWAKITRGSVTQYLNAGGVSVLVRFTVSAFTRLTT